MTNSKFETLLNNPNVRFTIILGSGFHNQAIGNNSILSNWEKLLKDQDPNLNITGFYPLDYEQLIVRRTANEQDPNLQDSGTEKIEQRISEEICHDLKCAQEKALKFNKNCYPKFIFNPDKVSDIISLNFDTTAETLCRDFVDEKNITRKHSRIFSDKNDELEIPFTHVQFENGGTIVFWYPHGSIHDKSKNILGIREYSKRLAVLERLRKHSKKKEREKTTSTTWYFQLTHNPVLILGADLKKDEWDMWFAIVNRERNFAKSENQQFKNPIFQMRECECQQDHRHEWFQPLFTGMKFDEQWRKLEELFKQ